MKIKNRKTYTFRLDAEIAELFDKYCAEAGASPQAAIEDLVVEMVEDFYLSVED
ncbi:MAG: hypothetical protein JSW52_06850 [Candidatus Coatesbacteria bacterium]|nr:MAG: hypothetical protein JSW52_06850 [Candidatus Coatesbacteria bacterium]